MTLIQAALGKIPLDTLIRNVTLANVITGEMYPADIGIYQGQIAMVEPPDTPPRREAREVIEGRGLIATPGLVDSHLHVESTLVTPSHFAEGVLPHGTTTVAEDPHEIGNVMGLEGIRLFWEASQDIPLKIHFLVSTCVPAAKNLETAGGEIGPQEAREMLRWERVIGLAEVMDMHAVIWEWPHITGILAEGKRAGGVIEGHNPMLRGRELNAYIAAGVDSDHTLAHPDVLREKMRLGVTVQLQERYLSREVDRGCGLAAIRAGRVPRDRRRGTRLPGRPRPSRSSDAQSDRIRHAAAAGSARGHHQARAPPAPV